MNEIPLDILFAILALLIVLSAFFSGSETALMTLNRYRLQHLASQHHKSALKVQRLLKRPDRLIGLILLGNNFVNIIASSVATVIALRLGGESAIAIGAGILTLVILVFAEVTPKTLAALRPEPLAFTAAWIYQPLLKLLYPLVWIINLFSNLLLRLIGVRVNKLERADLNKDELRSIVSEAESLIPSRYHNMLLTILDLESATVEDIMTPRNEVVGIDLEEDMATIVKRLENSPHTFVPVYRKSIDRVLGFIHTKNTMVRLFENAAHDHSDLQAQLIKPYFIPESTPLHTQLQQFSAENLRIGLVVDEYGDVLGLVTLEDILLEIVGELSVEKSSIVRESEGSYRIDASITLRELNRETDWSLPTDGPKTLNGLILETLETIPDAGTSLRLQGHTLEILRTDQGAITEVRFWP
ncbi:MAG: HlyC/CorC family transporter [Methylococcales bacterium]|nr:HlyC/CorC family transporter [Methylococcales bacterium]